MQENDSTLKDIVHYLQLYWWQWKISCSKDLRRETGQRACQKDRPAIYMRFSAIFPISYYFIVQLLVGRSLNELLHLKLKFTNKHLNVMNQRFLKSSIAFGKVSGNSKCLKATVEKKVIIYWKRQIRWWLVVHCISMSSNYKWYLQVKSKMKSLYSELATIKYFDPIQNVTNIEKMSADRLLLIISLKYPQKFILWDP